MKIGEKWVDVLEMPEVVSRFFDELPDRIKVCLMYKADKPVQLKGEVYECHGYYIAKDFGMVITDTETVYLLGPYYWEMAGKWAENKVSARELFDEILGRREEKR